MSLFRNTYAKGYAMKHLGAPRTVRKLLLYLIPCSYVFCRHLSNNSFILFLYELNASQTYSELLILYPCLRLTQSTRQEMLIKTMEEERVYLKLRVTIVTGKNWRNRIPYSVWEKLKKGERNAHTQCYNNWEVERSLKVHHSKVIKHRQVTTFSGEANDNSLMLFQQTITQNSTYR